MDWLSLVEENCGIKINSRERLFSRRNEVFLIEGIGKKTQSVKYVVKIYCQGDIFREPFIFRELASAGVKVPRVVWHNENIMVTEFISGTLLVDLMGNGDPRNQPPPWLDILARWFYRLHSVKRSGGYYLSMPDLNLRNFIFNGQDFFGLDFESLVFYPPERDLGGLAAFILNSDPMFEPWKFGTVRHLIKVYGDMREIDKKAIEHYFYEEMETAAQRRKGQREYLREKIKEMKLCQDTIF
ncbi:MAG: hypothetical protein ACOYI2_06250 [Bacillota bacterium]|jgi:hypothetical protein|nr:hypothetical protein [Clostridia bacterium]